MRELARDKHFRVFVDPDFRERPNDDTKPTSAEMDDMRGIAARRGYDIAALRHLPGNVGYLDLRAFGPTEFVGPAFSQAMSLLSGTDALILDLRRNGGGSPASVAYLMSLFFPLGDERHLNDIYDRTTNSTQQYWTVVGETTGGGANPVAPFSAGQGIVVMIPVARAINPTTKTNWEHVGVKPDIAVPAAKARQVAYVAILWTLLAAAKDKEERDELQRILVQAEKGETEQFD